MEDCSKYYRCLDDDLLIYSCPNGYLWDDSIKKCNVDTLVSRYNCTSSFKQLAENDEKRPLENAISKYIHVFIKLYFISYFKIILN